MAHAIGMISLGCPKNQVDAELMLAKLAGAGFEITQDEKAAELMIVNTCGFIEDAKKEAIETILETARLKEEGALKALVVTGCLAERYQKELVQEFPEVDVVAGIGANGDIVSLCREALAGGRKALFPAKKEMPLGGERILTTPSHWAYLKIADGCSNCCSYCAIPGIRGAFRSRPMEEIVEEATRLSRQGVRELILIAQDTTRYGVDLYGGLKLPELLDRLCQVEGIEWYRLFYCYPDRMTEELLDTIARQPKVLPYLDLPLQHADASILKRMNRMGSRKELTQLIEKIRRKLPGVSLRTTVMTGFPGEGEEEFTELAEFIRETRFDRLGCFAYSPEEGTPSASYPDQVEDRVKQHRAELIMQQQYEIMQEKSQQRVGKRYRVIVDDVDPAGGSYTGRSYMDAPEIDTLIYFTSDHSHKIGDFVDVEITSVIEYDLLGREVLGGTE